MASSPFKIVTAPPGLKDKLTGAARALAWAKGKEPPIGADRGGAYAAALAGASGENRLLLSRILVWCDLQGKTFRPYCAEGYQLAAEAFPDDDRCAFYVAALATHGLLPVSDEERKKLCARLMNPAWRKSSLWTRLKLSRDEALDALASGSDDIATLEETFRTTPERTAERGRVARRLGSLYRAAGCRDENALALARYLFQFEPDDAENVFYLAERIVESGEVGADALLIFTRALELADASGDARASDRWAQHLAKQCLETSQIDRGMFSTLWRAHTLSPDDRLLEAAAAYAGGLNEHLWEEPDVLRLLADVVAREGEIRPLFVKRRWRWETLVRALALAWGGARRNDRAAHVLYAHAVDLCPEDRQLWAYHASALASNRDTSPQALHAYERARLGGKSSDLVLAMLGHAYLKARAHLGPDRAKALAIWQDLYIRSLAGPEIAEVLGDVLAQNGDVSDIALHIWTSIAEREPQNGRIRCHLGAAMESRGAISEAVAWYREAARLLPDDFSVLLNCARLVKENTADATEVVRLLRHALTLPEGARSLDAHVLMGEGLAEIDQREEAKEVFRKVIEELDPGHTRSLLMLARLNLRYEQDGVATAEMLYARALEQEPDNPETYRRLAELYREEGETRLEQAALEKYLNLCSSDPAQYRQLVDMYMRRQDWERAENALRQLIGMGQADKKTYSLLGEVLHARNRAA